MFIFTFLFSLNLPDINFEVLTTKHWKIMYFFAGIEWCRFRKYIELCYQRFYLREELYAKTAAAGEPYQHDLKKVNDENIFSTLRVDGICWILENYEISCMMRTEERRTRQILNRLSKFITFQILIPMNASSSSNGILCSFETVSLKSCNISNDVALTYSKTEIH